MKNMLINWNADQIAYEAGTEEESKVLAELKKILTKYNVPFEKKGGDMILLQKIK